MFRYVPLLCLILPMEQFPLSYHQELIYRQLHALGYIPVAESLGISSTTFTQCAANHTEFGEITQNKGHYAIQGHSSDWFWYQSKAHIRLPISD